MEAQNQTNHSSSVCSNVINGTSITKRLTSKKHLENEKKIPTNTFIEPNEPNKTKIKRYNPKLLRETARKFQKRNHKRLNEEIAMEKDNPFFSPTKC